MLAFSLFLSLLLLFGSLVNSAPLTCTSEFSSVSLVCSCIADAETESLTAICSTTTQLDPCGGTYFYVCTSRLWMDVPLNQSITTKSLRFTDAKYQFRDAIEEMGGVNQPEYCTGALTNCKGERLCTPYSTGIMYSKSAHFSDSGQQFTTTTHRITNFYNPGCSQDCVLSLTMFPQGPCSVTCGTGVQPWAHEVIEKSLNDGECFNPLMYRKCELAPCDLPTNNTSLPSSQAATTSDSSSSSSTDWYATNAAIIAIACGAGAVMIVLALVVAAHITDKSNVQPNKQ